MLKPTVFFVDDEPSILSTLKRLFHGSPLTVMTFDSPEAALKGLDTVHPDVVVSDYRMPVMNGIALLEHFSQKSPETVRILLTGHIDIDAAIDAINRGSVFRFFKKPWGDEEILGGILEAASMAIVSRATTALPAYLGELLRSTSPEEACRTAYAFLSEPRLLGLTPGGDPSPEAPADMPESLVPGPEHEAIFREPKGKALLESLVKTALESCNIAAESAKARNELQILSERDPLSGLYNRRAIERAMATEWARAQRFGKVFSIMLMDIDNFKNINDSSGHETGDRVIEAMGRVLLESCRGIDSPGRYGGDEFLVVLPETTGNDAMVVAERIREKAKEEGAKLPLPAGLTLSIGIADTGSDPADTGRLVALADSAMYKVKKAGRNGAGFYKAD